MQSRAVSTVVIIVCITLSAGLHTWAAESESTAPAAPGTVTAPQPSPSDSSNAALAAKVQAIEQIVAQQQRTIEVQQRQIEELKAQGTKSSDSLASLESKVDETRKDQKKSELPSWLDGLKFAGDLRLRYEGIWLKPRAAAKDNPQHGRFRVRFGFEKKVSDDFDLGFRLASGKDNDPTTTNQTFTDNFAKKPVWIDLAYVTWHPTGIPGLVIGGGKTKNPYVNTDMVWSSDVNPEGVYERYKVALTDHVEPFIIAGQQMLKENDQNPVGPDAALLAVQPGVNVHFTKDVVWTNALAYYNFLDESLKGNWRTNSSGSSFGNTLGPGGTLAAKNFNILNYTSIFTTPVCGMPFSPYLDIAKNLDDKAIVTGKKRDLAYAVGAQIGDVKNKGDWSVLYKYARIDPDAIIGGFSDNSFGGSNRRGSKISASYGVAKNVTFTVSLYLLKPVIGALVETKTLQADLMLTF